MRARENATDLFAEIWHELAQNPSLVREAMAAQIEDRAEAELQHQDWASKQLRRIEVADGLSNLRSFLAKDGGGQLGSAARKLLVAQAIDQWFQGIGARALGEPVHTELKRAQYLLSRNGRFNTDASMGQVIPRFPSWGRWSEPDLHEPFQAGDENTRPLFDVFGSLIVIPARITATHPDVCDDLDSGREVSLRYRIANPNDSRDPEDRSIEGLVIGFAPLAVAADDIAMPIHVAGGEHWYDATPRDLGKQAADAIAALCAAGAHIVMFPEASMHPEAHAALQDAIAYHGKRSNLRLVIAGTTPRETSAGMPYNEATFYDWRGFELGRQRKLHRWNLDAGQRKPFALAPGMPSDRKLFERIRPGDDVTVFELAGLGRFSIMICEDLSRSEPGAFLRANLLLDWVFTPILDRSIEEQRWMHTYAIDAARGGRCRVAVCNSVSLTNRVNEVGVWSALADCGAALCLDRAAGGGAGGKAAIRHLVWRADLADPTPFRAVPWDTGWTLDE